MLQMEQKYGKVEVKKDNEDEVTHIDIAKKNYK